MTAPDRWLTVAEVAEYLQISRAKIYAMAQAGEIPCTKLAGQWRFKRDEIDKWMLAQAHPVRRSGPVSPISRGKRGKRL